MANGYVHPFPGATFSGRIDEGVDYTMPVGTPIRAIGNAIIEGNTTWYLGQPYIWYRLLDGPQRGRHIYVAEQITRLARPGTRVNAGDPIAYYARSGTAIEIGWDSGGGSPAAAPHYPGPGGPAQPEGRSFYSFLQSLSGRRTAAMSWQPCTLTWYDPALGGTNSSSGRADPTSATASGEPYNARAYTCAAPERFAFGTRLMFRYRGRVVTCKVNDRGGAISGVHFDLSRIAAEKLGMISAGSVSAEFAQVGAGQTAPASGITRPGGATADSGAGLEALYQSFLDEGKKGDTSFAAFTSATSATRKFISFIPGLPLPDIPGIPNLPDFNPFDLFKQGTDAITGVGDFLKLVGWLLNPRNIFRMVEFLLGLSLLYVGVRINLNVFRDAANERATKLLGTRKGGKGKKGKQKRTGQRRKPQGNQQAKQRLTDRAQEAATVPGLPKPNQKQLGKGGGGKGAGGKATSTGGKAATGSRAGSMAKTAIKIAPK